MTTNTLSPRMDHIASDTSISTQVLLTITLVLLILLVTSVNIIVWMVTRLITGRNDMFKYCQAGIVFANLITAAFCLPAQLLYISLGYWTFGVPLCIYVITLNSVTFVTVMWLVTVLVMDRVFNYRFQDVYLTFRKKYTRYAHLLIWALLLVLTLPFFLVEFLNQVYKLDNGGSRFHCHVPFDVTTALFYNIFGFVSPLGIACVMLTWLGFNIIKNRLNTRKKISENNIGKYIFKCEKRAMTPWGQNWLNDIEERVMKGPNNVLPPLRRHSIGECEQELNEDIPGFIGKERRNSLPEATSESWTNSQEQTSNDTHYYPPSFENNWCTPHSHTPSLKQKETGTNFNGIKSELPAKEKQDIQQQEHRFCETQIRDNSSDLGSYHEHDRSMHKCNVCKDPVQSKEDINLPGTVQTDQPVHQTVEPKIKPKRKRSLSPPRKQIIRCPSTISFDGDLVPLSDNHMKDNMWVRESKVENKLDIDHDDDDAGDDVDDEIRVTKILTVMVGLNIVLWLPLLWVYCQQSFCDHCQTSLAVWIGLKIIGQITLITNPVCLLLAHKDWKPLLKYVLSGFGRFSFQCFQSW